MARIIVSDEYFEAHETKMLMTFMGRANRNQNSFYM